MKHTLGMSIKLRTSVLSGICSLFLLFSSLPKSTLKDISKPYLGVYECTRVTIGSKDCKEDFSCLRLELKNEEDFLLLYKDTLGNEKRMEGKYRYENGKIVFLERGTGKARAFPLENGLLTVSVPMGGKTLIVQFERK